MGAGPGKAEVRDGGLGIEWAMLLTGFVACPRKYAIGHRDNQMVFAIKIQVRWIQNERWISYNPFFVLEDEEQRT
jgi:hypothetical protein